MVSIEISLTLSPLAVFFLHLFPLLQICPVFPPTLPQVTASLNKIAFILSVLYPAQEHPSGRISEEKPQGPQWRYVRGKDMGLAALLPALHFMEAVPDIFWKYS